MTQQVAARSIPSVLDIGLGQASTRQRFYRLAVQSGLSLQLHVLDVPAAERWQRIEKRNQEKGATYALAFDVTREMFDFVETLWEVPSAEEMTAHNAVCIKSQPPLVIGPS